MYQGKGKGKENKPTLAEHLTMLKSRDSKTGFYYRSKPEGKTRFIKVFGIPGVKKFTMVVKDDRVAADLLDTLVKAGYGHPFEEAEWNYRAAVMRMCK